jgi:methyltransferase (TIGR00027 family)
VARTSFIDRELEQAIMAGITQVVLLGAGYDSRGYRIEGIEKASVFEVDRHQTQALKRRVLARHLRPFPLNVAFVEIDFLRETLGGALVRAGFDPMRPTFFIWEGVTNYLDERAVDTTLRFIGGSMPGSRIAFTYVHRGLLDGTEAFWVSPNVARLLQRAGEPWTFGLYPSELPAYLRGRGLELRQDLGAVEYGSLYMGATEEEMKGYEFYHAAVAEVQAKGAGNCRK